jgi:hypothetical protein
MTKAKSPAIVLVAIIAFMIGALLGIGLAEHWWRMTHNGIYMWGRPPRNADYFLLSASWAIGFGFLGVAIAGFRLLPVEPATPDSKPSDEFPTQN